jgi:hypothetical protein
MAEVNITKSVPERAFTFFLTNHQYDVWFSEEQLQGYDDEDFAWFRNEIGLSRESLFRIFARAKEIVQQFRPNDDFLDLSYDADYGNWYIHFKPDPIDTNGRWSATVYRHEEHLKEEVLSSTDDLHRDAPAQQSTKEASHD